MKLKQKLEQIAIENGWRFVYARRDYQNLIDATNFIDDELKDAGRGETVLFMDPVTRIVQHGGEVRYTGNFMILATSNLDESYSFRIAKIIEPLIDFVTEKLPREISCDFDIDDWTVMEVINMFDFNADGVNVRFNLKSY